MGMDAIDAFGAVNAGLAICDVPVDDGKDVFLPGSWCGFDAGNGGGRACATLGQCKSR